MAVHVIVVSPSGKTSGASFEIDGVSTRSLETGLPSTTMFESADVASAVTESGAVMLGAVVSTTVTVWIALAELPDVSVAVHVIVVSPSTKNLGGCSVTEAIPITSCAVASPNSIIVLDRPTASVTMSDGAKISGGVVSTSVTT